MIKLHHLNQSRSKRIIWLLEELNVDYEIVPYVRDKVTFMAPPELKSVHPLGKSPLLEDDGELFRPLHSPQTGTSTAMARRRNRRVRTPATLQQPVAGRLCRRPG